MDSVGSYFHIIPPIRRNVVTIVKSNTCVGAYIAREFLAGVGH